MLLHTTSNKRRTMRPSPAATIIFPFQIIPFQDITRDANDDVSMDESIRSKEGPMYVVLCTKSNYFC
jgi:hypothetical protein